MKRIHTLWLGSEEGFHEYHALEQNFLEKGPQAYSSGREDDNELDPVFGVSASRPGLMLLEKFGGNTVLKIHGALSQRHEWWHEYVKGRVTSYEAIIDALDIAARDESRNRIVMDVSSPGGVIRGVDVATRKIRWAQQLVPVIAHTDSNAVSAGYWLASSASRVTASPMAEVGSIGSLLVTQTIVKAAEKAGHEFHVFRAGEFKALGGPYEEMSEKARDHLQQGLDKANSFFLTHVAAARHLPMAGRATWGEGKTFYADEALEVGLIDQVATLDEILGGGASHLTPSDTRSNSMKISDNLLAQIAAGADPKDVLTAEELKHYMASLEGGEAPADDTPEGEDPKTPEANEDGGGSSNTPTSDALAMTKEIGRLEAKLEAAEAKVTEMREKLEAKEGDISALLEVAQASIGNLCVALGRAREIPASATAVVSKYNELQGEMAARFKTGRQSAETPTQEGDEPRFKSFRHNV